MYNPPPSSSLNRSGPSNLSRYGSAPTSLLRSIVDSVVEDDDTLMNRYFSSGAGGAGDSGLTSESGFKVNVSNSKVNVSPDQRVFGSSSSSNNGLNHIGGGGGGGGGPLIRHSSSPAGFFNHLMVDNGFSLTRGVGSYNSPAAPSGLGIANGRLKSQLSFTRQDSLSLISEASETVADVSSSDDGTQNTGPSYVSGSFSMGPWDEANTIMFSNPNKRAKTMDQDIIAALDSHSQFGIGRTSSLETANIDKFLHLQPDSVPCKSRAKRGCATHPRSIAERERRTRISEKLRKLQELVPNMDKQTSIAEMLELAVHHIKGLQGEVQKLHKDRENCTCGCNQPT